MPILHLNSDNAAVYANEETVGLAISQSGIPREELYLTSKYDHLEGKDVETEFQESLQKVSTSLVLWCGTSTNPIFPSARSLLLGPFIPLPCAIYP